MNPLALFWGPHFPNQATNPADALFWGPHFPDPGPDTDVVPPRTPVTVGALRMLLDDGVTVTYAWRTDVFKSRSGVERRASIWPRPRMTINGSTLLLAELGHSLRSQLAASVALGQPFSLALPFEETGVFGQLDETLTVPNADALDWALPGERCLVLDGYDAGVEATVQEAAGPALRVDATIANAVRVMPLIAVYLDPQQGFARYSTPDGLERWTFTARDINQGFALAAASASTSMGPSNNGFLDGARLRARVSGTGGNALAVEMFDDALADVEIDEVGSVVTIHFEPGITVGELRDGINAGSTLVEMIGQFDDYEVISSDNEFFYRELTGGTNAGLGPVGRGAIVATYASMPVWDRHIENDGTSGDTLHAMTELGDLGGKLENLSTTDKPDGGRRIAWSATQGESWQWLKAFLDTVRGSWKSFWLSTWRNDLPVIAQAGAVITIAAGVNFGIWYIARRRSVQIVTATGAISRHYIQSAVTQIDGTTLATLSPAPPADIVLASWLELVRLESDEVPVTFTVGRFYVEITARVTGNSAVAS